MGVFRKSVGARLSLLAKQTDVIAPSGDAIVLGDELSRAAGPGHENPL